MYHFVSNTVWHVRLISLQSFATEEISSMDLVSLLLSQRVWTPAVEAFSNSLTLIQTYSQSSQLYVTSSPHASRETTWPNPDWISPPTLQWGERLSLLPHIIHSYPKHLFTTLSCSPIGQEALWWQETTPSWIQVPLWQQPRAQLWLARISTVKYGVERE